jgi:site-specific DNA-methyltransferase (adenine-specific)
LSRIPESSLHAIVTDPPYGVKEYRPDQLEKRKKGNGGVWRIPPAFDGHERSPLPRFTALNRAERHQIAVFFEDWSKLVVRVLRPGAHVFLASNSFLSHGVFSAIVRGGLEFRGELIRLVQTLRGGDRPKNAEEEFQGVSSMARSCHEPWGIFRKPLPAGMKVSECLRKYATGGLRRYPDGTPFKDVIMSGRTPQRERGVADHPSLKPQEFLRHVVYASLPLGVGLVCDPFMGSGSTVAAAEVVGYSCLGVEKNPEFFALAARAVPRLVALEVEAKEVPADPAQPLLFGAV